MGILRVSEARPRRRSAWLALGILAGFALLRRRHAYDLRKKNALVTGGSRGLGLEIARLLVARGTNVAIVARDPSELERALDDLRGRRATPSVRVIGESCDLCESAAIQTLIDNVRQRLGPVDVLVNDAGSIQVGPLDSMVPSDFERAMALHCFAPLRLMLAARRDMRARGGGRIANISSVGGLIAVPHLLPYCASKFALVGLSQGMRAELARDGILVSTVTPGLMRTGSPRNASFKGDHEGEHAWFAISDSLPLLSMSSTLAARRIVRALELGQAHVTLGWPAKLARIANGIAPGLVMQALAIANTLLPTGQAAEAHPGHQSESALAPSILTVLSDRAAVRNNEV